MGSKKIGIKIGTNKKYTNKQLPKSLAQFVTERLFSALKKKKGRTQ